MGGPFNQIGKYTHAKLIHLIQQHGGGVTIKESDGSPSVVGVSTINVTDGTLVHNGGTEVTITTGGGGAITVQESDGSPSVADVSTIKVSTGTLIDNGGGVVTLSTSSPNVVWNGGYAGSSELGGEDSVTFKYGTGTTTAKKLYYLNTSGAWAETDATDVAKGADALLGIASGTSPTSNGMLTRGILTIGSTYVNGTPAIGKVVYVGETAGEYTFTRPSSSGDYIRVVGWCIDVSGGNILLWFEPSTVWLELT